MNSSAERLRASSFVRIAVCISLTAHRAGSMALLPVICDRSLLRNLPLYFRMLRDASKSIGSSRRGHIAHQD
jgi:hypothetical protein